MMHKMSTARWSYDTTPNRPLTTRPRQLVLYEYIRQLVPYVIKRPNQIIWSYVLFAQAATKTWKSLLFLTNLTIYGLGQDHKRGMHH